MGADDVLRELTARLRSSVDASRKSRHECSFQWGGRGCRFCDLREDVARALTDAETDMEKLRLGIFRPSEVAS